jgi:molybdate transport system ATP-binding protein
MKLSLNNIRLPLTHFPLELDVELEGQVIAIFGPNGSGKTSLLDLIAGLRRPLSAVIELDGLVLADTRSKQWLSPQERGIGYVPQDGALFPHLSVLGNLTYGSKRGNGASLSTVEHVAEVLEISHLLAGGVGMISGGEKQRVALGRALLSQPRLLLLDEPLASLDKKLKGKGLNLLQRVRTEFAIPMLYVTHSAEEITAICDYMIFLELGKMVRRGEPKELFLERNVAVFELKTSAS